MKKLRVLATLSIVCILCCSALLFTSNVSANTDITVIINGKKMEFGSNANDPQPYIKEGRTLVPFRRIFEELEMDVTWNGETRIVYAKNATTSMELGIGRETAFVNGLSYTLDVPPEITDNRTFVPLRFVSESIGADVGWDGATRTVTITFSSKTIKLGQQITYRDRVFSVDNISEKDANNRIVITGTTNFAASDMVLEIYTRFTTSDPFKARASIHRSGDKYSFRAYYYDLQNTPIKEIVFTMPDENNNQVEVARYTP